MKEENFPSYYSVIPASVRYDKSLSPRAILLYGEITCLANKDGFCWATNSYFAGLYQVSEVSVSNWIKSLTEKNYIQSVYENTEKGTCRKLYINDVGVKENLKEGVKENFKGGVKENFNHNITSNNTTSNNKKTNKKDLDLEGFEEFWKLYDYTDVTQTQKTKCKQRWGKLDDETRAKIMAYVPEYVLTTPDKMYRKKPLGFFVDKKWTEPIPDWAKKKVGIKEIIKIPEFTDNELIHLALFCHGDSEGEYCETIPSDIILPIVRKLTGDNTIEISPQERFRQFRNRMTRNMDFKLCYDNLYNQNNYFKSLIKSIYNDEDYRALFNTVRQA